MIGLVPVNIPSHEFHHVLKVMGWETSDDYGRTSFGVPLLASRCQVLQWPLTYLGVPLGGNPRALSFWDPMVRKISKRLDCWKCAFFSLGDKITLIQLCLPSIPIYFISLFHILVAVA